MVKTHVKKAVKAMGRPKKHEKLRARIVIALRTLRKPSGRQASTSKTRGVSKIKISYSEIRKALGCRASNRLLKVECAGLLMSRNWKKRPKNEPLSQEQFATYRASQNYQGW